MHRRRPSPLAARSVYTVELLHPSPCSVRVLVDPCSVEVALPYSVSLDPSHSGWILVTADWAVRWGKEINRRIFG
jgi:hypothetical protein